MLSIRCERYCVWIKLEQYSTEQNIHPSIRKHTHPKIAHNWHSHRMHEVSRVAATSYTVCPQSSAAVWCGAVLGCTVLYCTVCKTFFQFLSYTVETNRLQIQSIAVVWSQRFNLCECVLSKKNPKQQSFVRFFKSFDNPRYFFGLFCVSYIFMFYLHFERSLTKKREKRRRKKTKILFKIYQYNLIMCLHSKCISVVNTLFYENNF